MQFAISLQQETGVVRFGETKTGKFKEGSIARALVFMNKQERLSAGQALYARWLSTGQFRPLVEDILACGLISKAAVPIVRDMAGLKDVGQVPKDVFIRLCIAVARSVQAAAAKKAMEKNDPKTEDYLPKPGSDKRFVYDLVSQVERGAAQVGTVIDAE